jgi:hypothetical protein
VDATGTEVASPEEEAPSWCLFQEPWFLDAMAPGQWREVTVEEKGRVVARLPFVYRRGRFGIRRIAGPRNTPWVGPWLERTPAKPAKLLGREKQLLGALIEKLPPHGSATIACDPRLTNLLPFHWAGFDLRVRYIYRIPDPSDLDAVLADLLANARGKIRKAEKQLEVRDDLGLDALIDTCELTFRRQGRELAFGREDMRRLEAAAREQKRCRMLFAVDARDRIHAACFVAWDRETLFYLRSGGDPELRASGAGSLLIWNAIQLAASLSKCFDFEGSMVEPIEEHFRSFGAVQTPRFVAERSLRRRYREGLRSILAP